MQRLTCERCGLVYGDHAIARDLSMATGAACRRCGGPLRRSERPRFAASSTDRATAPVTVPYADAAVFAACAGAPAGV